MKAIILQSILVLSAVPCFAQQRQPVIVTDSIFIRPYSFTTAIAKPANTSTAIPQNLYTQYLPFFCRQELKMQQAHVPITFRLGSMENCNVLEQKPGYR